ncbi:hypothetical protein NVP2275O_237 [Vibrio phage 2.275.O._10N.286.54.E11]|nr:hypothetical protein NVP2275O_237 [Vibrio phage 2.275.O._10N.286.54.E11]
MTEEQLQTIVSSLSCDLEQWHSYTRLGYQIELQTVMIYWNDILIDRGYLWPDFRQWMANNKHKWVRFDD